MKEDVVLMSKKTFESFIGDPELNAVVRLAGSAEDVEAIMALGKDSSFSVSPDIHFYEREELIEWAQLREENHLLVVTLQEAIVGFCFCKVMSSHWAVLDNLYVTPEHRKKGLGRLLMWALTARLKRRKVKYLSALTHVDLKGGTTSFMRTAGFRLGNLYHWQELFLEGEQREVVLEPIGKHIPLKEESVVPELQSEPKINKDPEGYRKKLKDFPVGSYVRFRVPLWPTEMEKGPSYKILYGQVISSNPWMGMVHVKIHNLDSWDYLMWVPLDDMEEVITSAELPLKGGRQ